MASSSPAIAAAIRLPVDITKAVRTGRNVVAVRVNNDWDATLAPRAGEHVFSGGLYRDVWLIATDAVHVPWTGTRITTPSFSGHRGKSQSKPRCAMTAPQTADVIVQTRIVDDRGVTVSTLPAQKISVAPGGTTIATAIISSNSKAAVVEPRDADPLSCCDEPAASLATSVIGSKPSLASDGSNGLRTGVSSLTASTAISGAPTSIRIRPAGAMPSPMARSSATSA